MYEEKQAKNRLLRRKEELTKQVMTLFEKAVSSSEGLREVSKEIRGEITINITWENGEMQVRERDRSILESIARAVIPEEWEWCILRTIGGPPKLLITRYNYPTEIF